MTESESATPHTAAGCMNKPKKKIEKERERGKRGTAMSQKRWTGKERKIDKNKMRNKTERKRNR